VQKEQELKFKELIAIADAMFAEHSAIVQAESDARYMEEFGHAGPRIASPLHSKGREYVFYRHRWSEELELPDPRKALGQV